MAKCLKIHTFALGGLQYFLLTYLSTEHLMPFLNRVWNTGSSDIMQSTCTVDRTLPAVAVRKQPMRHCCCRALLRFHGVYARLWITCNSSAWWCPFKATSSSIKTRGGFPILIPKLKRIEVGRVKPPEVK